MPTRTGPDLPAPAKSGRGGGQPAHWGAYAGAALAAIAYLIIPLSTSRCSSASMSPLVPYTLTLPIEGVSAPSMALTVAVSFVLTEPLGPLGIGIGFGLSRSWD